MILILLSKSLDGFSINSWDIHIIFIHKLLKAFFSSNALWEIRYWDEKKRVQTTLYVSVTEFWFQSINPKVVIWLDWTMVWSVNELLDYHASLSCRSRMSFAKTDIKKSVLGLYYDDYTEIGYLWCVYMYVNMLIWCHGILKSVLKMGVLSTCSSRLQLRVIGLGTTSQIATAILKYWNWSVH